MVKEKIQKQQNEEKKKLDAEMDRLASLKEQHDLNVASKELEIQKKKQELFNKWEEEKKEVEKQREQVEMLKKEIEEKEEAVKRASDSFGKSSSPLPSHENVSGIVEGRYTVILLSIVTKGLYGRRASPVAGIARQAISHLIVIFLLVISFCLYGQAG